MGRKYLPPFIFFKHTQKQKEKKHRHLTRWILILAGLANMLRV